MLADTSTENLSAEGYGLFGYNQGQLSLLLSRGVNDPSEFAVAGRDISEWLGSSKATVLTGENYESIIVPITDSTGMCVGVFEYKCTFGELYAIGDKLESRILTAVVIAVLAGVLLFAAQEILIRVIRNRQNGSGGKKNTETAQSRDRRTTIARKMIPRNVIRPTSPGSLTPLVSFLRFLGLTGVTGEIALS